LRSNPIRKVVRAMLLGLLTAGIVSMAAVPQDSQFISSQQCAVGGITLEMTSRDVRKHLGRPLKVTVDENAGIVYDEAEVWSYKDLSVHMGDGRVVGLTCDTQLYTTPDGAKVGDSVVVLFQLYGPTGSFALNGDRLYSYRVQGTDKYLIFHVKGGKVWQIELVLDDV
jgi:hypothetical protein